MINPCNPNVHNKFGMLSGRMDAEGRAQLRQARVATANLRSAFAALPRPPPRGCPFRAIQIAESNCETVCYNLRQSLLPETF